MYVYNSSIQEVEAGKLPKTQSQTDLCSSVSKPNKRNVARHPHKSKALEDLSRRSTASTTWQDFVSSQEKGTRNFQEQRTMKTSFIHDIPTSELKKGFPNYTSITRALCRKRNSDHVIIVSQKDQQ